MVCKNDSTSLTSWSSILLIRSPVFKPALAAGLPGVTSRTKTPTSPLSAGPTRTPRNGRAWLFDSVSLADAAEQASSAISVTSAPVLRGHIVLPPYALAASSLGLRDLVQA